LTQAPQAGLCSAAAHPPETLHPRRFLTRSFSTRPVPTMLGLLLGVILLAAAVFSLVEKVSYLDGVWWAVVTATTVGYGDIAPETVGMRMVAVIVIVTGLLTVAVMTAAFAANIVASRLQAVNDTQAIDDDFDYVIERVQQLKERYLEDEHGDDRVLDAAQRVIDAHRNGGGDMDGKIDELDKAIHFQKETDA
jgi:voltage-gated potassium channel